MPINIRRVSTILERHFLDAGPRAATPLVKVAEVMVIENPYCGRYVEDLSLLIDTSPGLATEMVGRAMAALGGLEVEGYGKAGLVGVSGEKEHANALLTTAFATPFRNAIGQADAWISSVTKVGAAGTSIDVPMTSKDDIYIRSHYDTMSLAFPGTPLPDEIALIFCLSTRGRLDARVGGLSLEDVREARRSSRAG